MPRRALNDRILKALKPAPAGKRYEIADAVLPAMLVRVTDRGAKSFALLARFPGSTNPTRRTLGTYPATGLAEARERAREWLGLLERGIDPAIEAERQRAAEQRKQAQTVASVAESFFTRKLKTQRRGHVVERIVRRELLPHWGKRPIADITHREVRQVVESVVGRGAGRYAHNVLDAANALFNYAVAMDALEINPCRLIPRKQLLGAKKIRTRVLNDDELRAFWEAAKQMGYPFGPFYQLMVLTGGRLDELAGARWQEFDLGRKVWTVPGARHKSGTDHTVPLSDDAMVVLGSLPRFGGDCLFTTTAGRAPVRGFSKAKQRLDRNMRAAPFQNHDVRRTVRTRLSALRIPDHVAELVIGHGRKGLARVYDQHAFAEEKAEALASWARLLRSIVDPPPPNVVPLRSDKRAP